MTEALELIRTAATVMARQVARRLKPVGQPHKQQVRAKSRRRTANQSRRKNRAK